MSPEGKIVAVVAACIIKDGYVLMQGRENENRLQDYYQFPGGKVEEGETLEAALAREIREELGCEIEEPLLIHARINMYSSDPKSYLVLFFLADLLGEPKPLVGSLHWIPTGKLQDYKTLPGTVESIIKADHLLY